MADVSFSGLSTGIDTAALIKALVDAKRQPIVQLQKQADGFQSRLTQLGDLAGKLGALRTAVTALAYTNTFASYLAASSDKDVVTAASSSAASEGNHTLEITQLAKAQTTRSDQTYASSVAALGLDGTLTLTPAGGSASVVTLAATDTLEGVRDKINSSVGASTYAASILNAGTAANPSYSLILTARSTGTASGFTASFAGAGAFTFTNSQGSQDAVISVDGITGITRSSNVIGDVLTGVTFTLGKDTSVSGPVSVTVSKDTSSGKKKIEQFITAYNDLRSYIHKNTLFDPTTKTGGPLMGESAVETISRGLGSLITNSVTGLTGSYTALSRIGITSDKSDGTLTLDSTKLEAAMTADFQGVARLFGRDLSSGINGVAYQIQSKIDGWMSSVDGVITIRKGGIQRNIDRINSQISQKESGITLYEASLKIQFARLEQLVSTLKDQSGVLNSLSAQVK
ncbi:MAG: flagellar filament capping protein FliD [Candidatus Deferrimicrobiaceae bacterium]